MKIRHRETNLLVNLETTVGCQEHNRRRRKRIVIGQANPPMIPTALEVSFFRAEDGKMPLVHIVIHGHYFPMLGWISSNFCDFFLDTTCGGRE